MVTHRVMVEQDRLEITAVTESMESMELTRVYRSLMNITFLQEQEHQALQDKEEAAVPVAVAVAVEIQDGQLIIYM